MNKKNSFILAFIGFFIIVLIYRIFENYNNEKMLVNSVETEAVIFEIRDGSAVHDSATAKYYFFVNGVKIENEENINLNFMSVGDTILIEYAVEDPSVARVVDKYYMKKYRHLKKR